MRTDVRGRVARVAAAAVALACSGVAVGEAAPLPAFAGTTVVTARGNGGVALYLPKTSMLDTRGREPHEHAVTITRRGGTYAFVGLSEPDACKRYDDPYTAVCMAVHGYDMAAFRKPGMPDTWAKHVVTLDPAMVGKGRIDVYVLTDGEVTLTVRFKGLSGTRRVRADRRITGWMHELPRNCAASCDKVAYGGAAHDVGPAGFVAGVVLGVRDVDSGTPTPLGPLMPGTQFTNLCVYGGTAAWEASPDPSHHPTGCDPVGSDPMDTTSKVASLPTTAHPMQNASGWAEYEYGARGTVYVGFHGVVEPGAGAWHSLAGYGVWLKDGIR